MRMGLSLSLVAMQAVFFTPASLFASSEPGVWYDPSDLTTLFQDTAGTQPVTTPGQTVALALDKSKGLALGAELVTNGTFDGNSTTGWVAGFGRVDGTFTASGGIATLTQGASDTSPRYVTTLTGLVSGQSYELRFTSVGQSGSGDKYVVWTNVSTGTGGSTLNQGATGNWSGQSRRFIVTATASTMYVAVGIVGGTTGSSVSIDNISVRELPGFHATQATSASRPTYGIVPATGRRNLLTFSESFDNAAWVKTGLQAFGSGSIANATTAPDGTLTADFICENTAAGNHRVNSAGVRYVAGTTVTSTVRVKSTTRNYSPYLGNASGAVTATFDLANGTRIGSASNIGDASGATASIVQDEQGFWLITLSGVVSASSSTDVTVYHQIVNGTSASYTGDGTSGILIWGAQLELGSTATAYQRVGSSFDVTEAGVDTLHYLYFGGATSPRFMITPTITPGTDKVQVFAGVRKLSDAAQGIIAELSATVANPGAFNLQAPGPSGDQFRFVSGGSTGGTGVAGITSGHAAPVTRVQTGLADISSDTATLRLNGTQVAQSTADQGTGNFLAYPLYIGMRGPVATPSLPFEGNLYGLIVRFGANLTGAQITPAEYWLNGKTRAY